MPSSALGTLLDISCLIDHQYRTRITQVLYHEIAQIIAYRVGVPYRAGQ
jgi:hypothetical protein